MRLFKKSAGVLVASALVFVVAGCAVERPEEVPGDALLVSEGQDTLAFRATSDGRVYVYDVNGDRIVYSGEIRRGETIKVDAEKNRVSIADRTVFEKGLAWNNQHRLYFDPHGDVERRVTVEETTVIERDVRK